MVAVSTMRKAFRLAVVCVVCSCTLSTGVRAETGGENIELEHSDSTIAKDPTADVSDVVKQRITELQIKKHEAVANEAYLQANRYKLQIEDLLKDKAGQVSYPDPGEEGVTKMGSEFYHRHMQFFSAFLASLSMILVSELGDKTFFIAAIMAMRHSRATVFCSAILALAVMTVLSAAMGFTLPNLMPRSYTHYAAMCLFVFFGLVLIKDAYYMDPEEPNEELEEVEEELAHKKSDDAPDLEGGHRKMLNKSFLLACFSPIFIQCFTMTFLAEWGDRSQIATIALAAAKDPFGVILGGILGHSCCTGLAVIGGKLLATRISERAVAAVGGTLFFMFALHSFITGPETEALVTLVEA